MPSWAADNRCSGVDPGTFAVIVVGAATAVVLCCIDYADDGCAGDGVGVAGVVDIDYIDDEAPGACDVIGEAACAAGDAYSGEQESAGVVVVGSDEGGGAEAVGAVWLVSDVVVPFVVVAVAVVGFGNIDAAGDFVAAQQD